jgi:hypothetical protein
VQLDNEAGDLGIAERGVVLDRRDFTLGRQ